MLENESLTDYANRLAHVYNNKNNKSFKKDKGQFFTPSNLAKFMAGLSSNSRESVSILDPGAGIGILSAAVIEKLMNNGNVKKIKLVCYENDPKILHYLNLLLEETKKRLRNKVSFEYSIIKEDFVKSNAHILTTNLRNYSGSKSSLFNIIISNPPYFKLNKSGLQTAKFKDVISGQPNIYFLFMALSARLLADAGDMIFITPRSFCSGLYYSKFRTWLIDKVNLENVHLFDSRKQLFSSDNVLQESIITKFTRRNVNKIRVSKTLNADFSKIKKIDVSINDVIYRSNGHIFFRIPSSEEELRVVRGLDKLPHNFYKLGVKISTGKVVAFRNKKYLQKEVTKDSVPLLWMHNIKNGEIKWPLGNKDKATAIKNTNESRWLLQESGNYLVLKRFTTKEQKKRFITACIFKEAFSKYGYFALDNMVNYVYRPGKPLTRNQIKGIAKYLDLPAVDLYFRILNGHTQVNANEVYALPFPSLERLELFGKDNGMDAGILEIKPKIENSGFADKQVVKPIPV